MKAITEEKIYELALKEKRHQENRRDDINNHYISLFAAIIAVTPFIDKVTVAVPHAYEGLAVRLSLTLLSLIGLTLSIIWSANLKRILFYLESLDKIIMELEKRHDISFATYIFNQLEEKNSPDRITRYQLVMPYTFMIIFISIIIYSLSWIIAK